jgi:hypothetical protein
MILSYRIFVVHKLVGVIMIFLVTFEVVDEALTSEHILMLSYSFLDLQGEDILFLKLAYLLAHNL